MKEHITPEVGDIYLYKEGDSEFKVQVYYIGIESGENVIKSIAKCGTSILEGMHKEFNPDNFIYLGKSKANIDDLFKTENE